MKRKKEQLTEQEHIDLGKELKKIRDRMVHLTVELGNRYNKKIATIALRAQIDIDRLRSELDEIWFKEGHHVNKRIQDRCAYYPGPFKTS